MTRTTRACLGCHSDAVVADAISPELAEQWSVEGFAEGARIAERADALTKKCRDAARLVFVELAELLDGTGREPPTQRLTGAIRPRDCELEGEGCRVGGFGNIQWNQTKRACPPTAH